MILGPRRVGKTTVLYQTVRHLIGSGIAPGRIWWLRMDHPLLLEASLGDLARGMLRGSGADEDNPLFLMLDEVVYAANWDLWLKTFYDEDWPVRIAATSSGTAGLRKQRRESGVGRWEEHHLMPCQLDEFLGLLGRPPETEAFGDAGREARRVGSGRPGRPGPRRTHLPPHGGAASLNCCYGPSRQSRAAGRTSTTSSAMCSSLSGCFAATRWSGPSTRTSRRPLAWRTR